MSRGRRLLALILALGAPSGAAESGGASVEARLPFGTRYRPGRPFPAEVRARAGAERAEAVEIADGGHAYRVRLALAPGASGRVPLWAVLGDDPTGARVRLLGKDGRVLVERPLESFPRPLAPDERLVVIVTRRGGMWPRLPAPSTIRAVAARVDPADLPERACAWAGADLVVVEDLPTGSPKAITALGEWLRAGGRVILASPEAAARAGTTVLPGENWASAPWEEIKGAGARDGDVLAWLAEGKPAAFRFRRAFGEGVVLRFDYATLTGRTLSSSRARRAAVRAFKLMLSESEPGNDPRIDPALYAAMPDPWDRLPRASAAARTALVLLVAVLAILAVVWRSRRRVRALLLAGAGFALAGAAFVALALPRAEAAVGVFETVDLSREMDSRGEVFALVRSAGRRVRAECTSRLGAPRVVAPSADRLRAWDYVVNTDLNTIAGPGLACGEALIFAAGPRMRPLPPFGLMYGEGWSALEKPLVRWRRGGGAAGKACSLEALLPSLPEALLCGNALRSYRLGVGFLPPKEQP